MVKPIRERFGPEGWPVTGTESAPAEGFDGYMTLLDNTKSRECLGIQYRPVSETVVDMAAKMIEMGTVSKL